MILTKLVTTLQKRQSSNTFSVESLISIDIKVMISKKTSTKNIIVIEVKDALEF